MRKLSPAEISAKRKKPEEVSALHRLPVVVIVDNVRSLYNVGSLFRTSDAAQIEKMVLTGFTPRPPRKEIEKTALGATQSVLWEYVANPIEAVESARRGGYRIMCLEITDQSRPYFTLRREDFPLALIIGNELSGVSPELVARCDDALEIPMYGIKHSLNVAVAYGIALFEMSRVWRAQTT